MSTLRTGKETDPNRVEFYRRKKWLVATFNSAGEAYRFWLYLKRGTYAKLFQDGKETGAGA